MRSRDTNDKTESSDKEFPGTDEKESACKEPSLVFNTTDEQKKILNDIISNESHRDAEDYKYCENILCGYLYDGDLVFVILRGIYGF